MRFEDERYVRLYTRDTLTWKRLGWEGRSVLPQLMRKVDRAGVVEIDEGEPAEALAMLLDMPEEVTKAAWPKLVATGTVTLRDDPSRAIILPNFLEAQEAKSNDRARQQKAREMARAHKTVTGRDDESQGVTNSHTASHGVTPSCAVPSLAVPDQKDSSPAAPSAVSILAAQAQMLAEPVAPPLPRPSGTAAEERLVFDHWRKARGKREDARFSDERRKKIRARLHEGFTVEKLCRAIDGVALDTWEERPRHDDLELILRDSTHVEKFIAFADSPPKAGGGTLPFPRQQSTVRGVIAPNSQDEHKAEAAAEAAGRRP